MSTHDDNFQGSDRPQGSDREGKPDLLRALTSVLGAELRAPDELLHRVAIELEEPAARFGRAFKRCKQPTVSPELDAAVESELSDFVGASDLESWEQESITVRGLRGQRHLEAPAVLARLVDEELRSPEAALASRWIGGLSPLTAPDLLAERLIAVDSSDASPKRGVRAAGPAISGSGFGGHPLGAGTAQFADSRGRRRRSFLGSALLAAAALLLMIFLRDGGDSIEVESGGGSALEGRWAFRVVIVDDPAQVGPQAAGLLSALQGGYLPGEAR